MIITPKTTEGFKLMHEGAIALATVEANGMRVDVDYIKRKLNETKDEVRLLKEKLTKHKITKRWKEEYGRKFNFTSREQLGHILFDVLQYKSPGLTRASEKEGAKKKRHKTDEESLRKLNLKYLNKYLQIGRIEKMRSTYLKGILRHVVDGYVHPFFNLHTTQTFRSSSDSPNFQNIPIRIPETSKLIRSAFIARKNGQIVEIDYGGAEVCCSACYNLDPNLIKYIKDDSRDMHRDMAAQCFMLPNDFMQQTDKQNAKMIRYVAKNDFVFPQFYGSGHKEITKNMWEDIGKYKLSFDDELLYEKLEEAGIDERGACGHRMPAMKGSFEHHIKQVEKHFWGTRFKVYDKWREQWLKQYKANMFFDTLTGFRISGVLERNQVINYPVQGSAFHWLLWSLIQIQKALDKYKIKALIVGQIHDSIVADVYKKHVRNFIEICQEVMTERIKKHWPWIIVPLKIDAEVAPVGASWYDKEEYKL